MNANRDERTITHDSPLCASKPRATVPQAICELMRLPNVFTAMADVAMGVLFVQRPIRSRRAGWTLVLAALLASALLYAAGVVLNDVFDAERSTPASGPSGRCPRAASRCRRPARLGWELLVLGRRRLGLVRGVLRRAPAARRRRRAAAGRCILLYDAWLKRTPLGPLAMGACRMLNVLLGMSAVDAPLGAEHWLVAGGIGVYVAGVTWFARTEAEQSSRLQLVAGHGDR